MPFAGGPGKPLREQSAASLWRLVGVLHAFGLWPLSFVAVAIGWGAPFPLPARVATLACGVLWAALLIYGSLGPFNELRRRGSATWQDFTPTLVLGGAAGAAVSVALFCLGR